MSASDNIDVLSKAAKIGCLVGFLLFILGGFCGMRFAGWEMVAIPLFCSLLSISGTAAYLNHSHLLHISR